MKKYRITYLQMIVYVAALLGLFIGSQIIVSVLSVGVMGEEWMERSIYFMMLISYSITLLGLVGINKLERDCFRAAYKGFTKQNFFQAFAYVIPLWLVVGIVNGLLYPFFPEYEAEISSIFYAHETFLRFVVIVIGAPFLEEYIFRYKIQNKLKQHFGKNIAVIFQGLLFGMIHSFGLQKIYASILGIGFGWVKEKTNHILTPTVMHMIINGIGFLTGEMLNKI